MENEENVWHWCPRWRFGIGGATLLTFIGYQAIMGNMKERTGGKPARFIW
jgi:hypothetical protein